MHDGSITFSTALDNAQLEKDLAGLTKKIEKQERKVADLALKRDTAKEKGLFDVKELDAEKAKLQEIKDRLADIREMVKDKGLSTEQRGNAKSLIPTVQEELKEQQARVSALQAEWNKTENAAVRYSAQLADAEAVLKRQKEEAGYLQQQIDEAAQQAGNMNFAAKTIDRLRAELKELENQGKWFGDEDYDILYGELIRVTDAVKSYRKEVARSAAHMREMADSAGIADQHIADLGQELTLLQGRLSELKKADIGLGHKEFDDISARIAEINSELKDYKKGLTSAAGVDLSGAAAKKAADKLLQGASDHASETMKWISRLQEELDDLQARKSSLGLALGAKEEYDQIQGAIDSVTQHLEGMREELDELARSGTLGGLANGSEIAEQRIAELKDEMAGLQEQQSNLGLALGAKQEYDDLSAEIERVGGLLEDYKNNLNEEGWLRLMVEEAEVADQHIVDLCQELDELKARQTELGRAGIGLGYQEYDDNAARISAITSELNEYQKALTKTGSAAEQTAKKTESAIRRLVAAMKKGNASEVHELLGAAVNSVFQKISSGLGRVQKSASDVKQFGKTAVKAFTQAALAAVKLLDKVNVFPKMFSATSGSLKKLGQMIRRVFVFSVITAGLRTVRSQMSAYLTVNTEFSSALGQLKGVLLTAFQPIYDVVVPALTVLMNLLARAIAAITQFTAVLFGTTAKQAQKNAQALYKQAQAASAAGSAAEEAAGSLARFDEINTISTENSGGGGGASAETGPLFDWEYEDTPFPDWGEAFSAFLDKILGNIPKLKDALKDFADWFNDLTEKTYDMFTFPGVLEKVERLGRELADAFNGLVVQIDWYQLGRAMGAGLNLALQLLTEFIYTFDWITLGMALAAMVNGIAAQVDWYDFGRLLWSGFKIGLETLAGFILGLDMPLMAEAASKIVMGFFDEMKNTLDRINWREIGEKIRSFLVSIQWMEIADSVFGAIKSAFSASSDFFSGLLGDELKRTLTDMLIEISKYTLVIGTILVLSGVNVPLGIALMKVGAASLAAAAALDWEYVSSNISQIVSEIAGVLGGALLVIGAILILSGANIPLGIGLMVAGAASLAAAMAINWDFIPTTISGIVTTTLLILGAALLVLGAILTFSSANIPLGIGLMALGAVSLAAAAAVNWDILPNTIGGIVSKITAIVSAALLVLGVVLLFTGAAAPLGLGLLALGAVGLAASTTPNWNFILEAVQEAWHNLKTWWDTNAAKFFTLDYWKDLGKNMIDGLLAGLQGIFSGLAGWASNVWSTITGAFSSNNAKASISGAVAGASAAIGRSNVQMASMPDVTTYSIPALAQGAVIPPNREFMAVLGDQTSGNNLEAPESLIRKIVREEAGGSNTALLEAILEAIKAGHVIMVDRRVLGKTVTDEQNRMTRQSGRSVVLG